MVTMQSCIDECLSCHRICVETAKYCLEKGGKHAEADHIRTMLDCTQSCATSADFMLRGSELHTYTCGACAAVCEACAVSCEKFGDDAVMSRCAKVCRSCAECCREMAASRRAA
jgi:hypothetical protein